MTDDEFSEAMNKVQMLPAKCLTVGGTADELEAFIAIIFDTLPFAIRLTYQDARDLEESLSRALEGVRTRPWLN